MYSTETKNRKKNGEKLDSSTRPMSNGMAAVSREDTTPQSFADAHCSSTV